MQQLVSVWSALSLGRKTVVIGATLAMFAAVLLLGRMATTPGQALLYSGLESGAAGEVVAALDQRGIAHEVRGNAIYVPEDQRDQLRMTLAAEGLPANTGSGYEILDGLSGFGTTSQMFDAAYWRAKEGELARTITANPRIRAARVHIANVTAQPFRKEIQPTASVTVTTSDGLPVEQARALRYMIASAVPGMRTEDVSVIDSRKGLILSGEDAASSPLGQSADRAEALRRSVMRMLEARVGPGRAVVEVSLDTVTERESITEKRVDPAYRVAISQDAEERSSDSSDQQPPAAGVASNLPEGDATQGGKSQSRNSETRERTNFEVSQVQREVLKAPGAIRRMTVAVLLDGVRSTGPDGAPAWAPLPDAEIAALHDLVASAVGFDEQRGDVITLKSLPLEQGSEAGASADSHWLPSAERLMPMAQIGLLGLVALAIGFFVIRPILAPKALPDAIRLPGPEAERGRPPVLTGEIDDGAVPTGLPVVGRSATAEEPEPEADPVARLRRLISERQNETVEILRGWMEDKGERA